MGTDWGIVYGHLGGKTISVCLASRLFRQLSFCLAIVDVVNNGKEWTFRKTNNQENTQHHHRFRRHVVCGGLMGQYVAQIERYHWPS